MILVTGATGDVGRHVASHLLRTGVAVRSSTRGPDPADQPGSVVDNLKQRTDPINARIAVNLAA